jgi:hypothetical protein
MLDTKISHSRRGKRHPGPVLTTYADGVTIVLRTHAKKSSTSEKHLKLIQQRLVHVWTHTSLKRWRWALGTHRQTILGTRMRKTVGTSARQTWNIVTGHIKSPSKEAYCRALPFDKKFGYVQTYLLARVWYVAQVFPPPSDNMRQIDTTKCGSCGL